MLVVVRYVLPALICLAAVVVFIVSPGGFGFEGGMALLGAGLAVALLNLLYRVGSQGDEERDQEEAARRYYDEHGRWPDGRQW